MHNSIFSYLKGCGYHIFLSLTFLEKKTPLLGSLRYFLNLFKSWRQPHFTEKKEEILAKLGEREWELNRDWLRNTYSYLGAYNTPISFKWDYLKLLFKHWIGPAFMILLSGGLYIIYIWKKYYIYQNFLWILPQLNRLYRSKMEIKKAEKYFQEVEDNEKYYRANKELSAQSWSENLISTSLLSLTFNPGRSSQDETTKDTYLSFLYFYSLFVSVILTGGLILPYFIYRKLRDPKYKFLEGALQKYVIDHAEFEESMRRLISKTYGFDIVDRLSFYYSTQFEQLKFDSLIKTKWFRSPCLRVLFFIFMNIFSLGLYSLYNLYSFHKLEKREDFYNWWRKRRAESAQIIRPLGNISRKWWGKGVETFRTIWTDLYISIYLSHSKNCSIVSSFSDPKWGLRDWKWALFWIFSSPLFKFAAMLLLLLFTYALILCWSFQWGWVIASWPFYTLIVSGFIFIILLGYHIFLLI